MNIKYEGKDLMNRSVPLHCTEAHGKIMTRNVWGKISFAVNMSGHVAFHEPNVNMDVSIR